MNKKSKAWKLKRYNGLKRRSILLARGKILREAERKGHITNARAKEVGNFSQVWFHLKAMEAAGVLEHTSYNEWKPVSAKKWPKLTPYTLGPRR